MLNIYCKLCDEVLHAGSIDHQASTWAPDHDLDDLAPKASLYFVKRTVKLADEEMEVQTKAAGVHP